ncbi:substrate-binding periplasmic protein [Pseudomonas sp. LRF_L74]|uniref:substrate-binding periplasmic protein n=1 Tax=Pseudomonas sp. LRF_L74 TaxID=3369422 RepID=UPI003F611B75
MRALVLLSIACSLMLPNASTARDGLPTVELYIPQAPPLAMPEPGHHHGITGDLTLEAIRRAGYQAILHTAPWLRIQKQVQEGSGRLIIPLTRTPERESLYTWVAPIMALPRAFFSLDEPVASFEEARKRYRNIAVGLGTVQLEILLANGFRREQIHALRLGENPVALLQKKRIDAWFTTVPEGLYIMQEAAQPTLRMSPPLTDSQLYLGCSLDCDPQVVEALREAFDSLRNDGSIQRIYDSYLSR